MTERSDTETETEREIERENQLIEDRCVRTGRLFSKTDRKSESGDIMRGKTSFSDQTARGRRQRRPEVE